jgi:hypothetical protein
VIKLNKNKTKTNVITIAYIVGIILDGLMGFDMFLSTQPVMMLGTALMIGWTILLLWGLQKPIERKGTLIITAFPVVFLYLVYDIFQYINDISIVNVSSIFSLLIIRSCLIILLIMAYIFANQIKSTNEKI